MEKRMKALTTVLMLLLTVLFIAVPMQQVGATTYTGYVNAIQKTADRLVALQSSIDYGWDWVVTGLTNHTASPSATNLYGVTALGLLEAYQKIGNSTYLTAAENAANFMMYGNASNGDFYNGHGSYYWGYADDYIFLMTISAVSGNSSYANYALAAWPWQKAHRSQYYGDGNQSALWNYYRDSWIGTNMSGAAAFGTSDWGLAALEMGDTVWAQHMAAVIHANMANILTADVTSDYKDMGMGRTLSFLAALGNATYTTDITQMKTKLLSPTDLLSDGSWDYGPPPPGDPQTTAYVVVGMLAAGNYTAAKIGADWLLANQMVNGGWNEYGDELSEPDSEVMQALLPVLSSSTDDVAIALNSLVINATIVLPGGIGNIVKTGDIIQINLTAQNKGQFDETFGVTVHINHNDYSGYAVLPTQTVTLAPGATQPLTFYWNTAGAPQGGYIIEAIAATVPGETNTRNNIQDIDVTLAPSIPLVPVVTIVPSNKTWMVGGTFDLNVTVANADPYWGLAGYSVTIGFNSSVIQVSNIVQSSYLGSPSGTLNYTDIDNVTGDVTFAATEYLTISTPPTSGVLFTLTFKAVGLGSCNLTMLDCQLAGWANLTKWVIINAIPIPNTSVGGNVTIIPPLRGDLNFDGKISLADLVILAQAYGSTPSSPNWNPNADLAAPYGIIGLSDLVTLALNYGKTYLVDP